MVALVSGVQDLIFPNVVHHGIAVFLDVRMKVPLPAEEDGFE